MAMSLKLEFLGQIRRVPIEDYRCLSLKILRCKIRGIFQEPDQHFCLVVAGSDNVVLATDDQLRQHCQTTRNKTNKPLRLVVTPCDADHVQCSDADWDLVENNVIDDLRNIEEDTSNADFPIATVVLLKNTGSESWQALSRPSAEFSSLPVAVPTASPTLYESVVVSSTPPTVQALQGIPSSIPPGAALAANVHTATTVAAAVGSDGEDIAADYCDNYSTDWLDGGPTLPTPSQQDSDFAMALRLQQQQDHGHPTLVTSFPLFEQPSALDNNLEVARMYHGNSRVLEAAGIHAKAQSLEDADRSLALALQKQMDREANTNRAASTSGGRTKKAQAAGSHKKTKKSRGGTKQSYTHYSPGFSTATAGERETHRLVGTLVNATWKGRYYAAYVEADNGDGTLRVRWVEDGSITKRLQRHKIAGLIPHQQGLQLRHEDTKNGELKRFLERSYYRYTKGGILTSASSKA
jgi:hypothetical protein